MTTRALTEQEKHHNATFGITPTNPVIMIAGTGLHEASIPALGRVCTFGPYDKQGVYKVIVEGLTIHIRVVNQPVHASYRRCTKCLTLLRPNYESIGTDILTCPNCGVVQNGVY